MRLNLTFALVLVLLSGLPSSAQRPRRPATREDTGPVQVTRAATLRVTIASDAVGIFEYLSDAKKLEKWFPDQAIAEPQFGGKYHFRWKDSEGVWSGVITEFIRGNAVGFTWQPPGEKFETKVQFKLSPEGDETVVTLNHSGFTTNDALDKSVKSWVFYLQNLKSVIEQGIDMRKHARQGPSPPPKRARRR